MFTGEYAKFSITQLSQGGKLLGIMEKTLKFKPEKILDIGCGDGKHTIYLAKRFPEAKVIGIDISGELIKKALERKRIWNLDNIEFFVYDYFEFKDTNFDIIFSNNTFHWFGDKAPYGYEKLSYHLIIGGYFFIHQGEARSYINLRHLMEKMLKERGIEPPRYPLFYPTRKELENLLKDLGYGHFVIKEEIEDYIENEKVYVDFTYAGGLPYIEILPENERENFRKEFIKRCIEEKCSPSPVRLYIYGRNDRNLKFFHIKDLKTFINDIKAILEETDKEFIPPLSSRFSTTQNVFSSAPGSIELYLTSLEKQEMILCCNEKGKVIGFLSFIRNYEMRNKRWVYVSTIAVRRKARGIGIGKKLYLKLFEVTRGPFLTRTWNGNEEHIRILKKLGFREIYRIPNHRGKSVDTIYYGKD